jgi:hypothetical protein
MTLIAVAALSFIQDSLLLSAARAIVLLCVLLCACLAPHCSSSRTYVQVLPLYKVTRTHIYVHGHTHTHSHTHTHTHTRTHKLTYTHNHTRTHSLKDILTHLYAHAHPHTHTHTYHTRTTTKTSSMSPLFQLLALLCYPPQLRFYNPR